MDVKYSGQCLALIKPSTEFLKYTLKVTIGHREGNGGFVELFRSKEQNTCVSQVTCTESPGAGGQVARMKFLASKLISSKMYFPSSNHWVPVLQYKI